MSTIEAPPVTKQRELPAFARSKLGLLIDGEMVDARSGKTIAVENPATGEVIAQVPAGEAVDVDAAVLSARRSFDKGSWRKQSAVQREQTLWRLSDLLERHLDELVELEIIDNGMPISLVTRAIERAIDGVRYYAGMCTKLHGVTTELSGQRAEFHAYSLVEPVGVVGLIVPWNSPLSAACNKVAPALAAGCSCVLKPAEQTPLTALRLGQLALEAGVPPGVLNVVTGIGSAAGAALAQHPDVDKISFTGSTEVGKALVKMAAGNLKRLTLSWVASRRFLCLTMPTCRSQFRARQRRSFLIAVRFATPARACLCSGSHSTRWSKGSRRSPPRCALAIASIRRPSLAR